MLDSLFVLVNNYNILRAAVDTNINPAVGCRRSVNNNSRRSAKLIFTTASIKRSAAVAPLENGRTGLMIHQFQF